MSTEVFDNLIFSTSLESLLSLLLDKLAAQRENQKKILYVAGTISSDGDHKIAENIEKLLNHRRRLTVAYADLAFVFASPDIFTQRYTSD